MLAQLLSTLVQLVLHTHTHIDIETDTRSAYRLSKQRVEKRSKSVSACLSCVCVPLTLIFCKSVATCLYICLFPVDSALGRPASSSGTPSWLAGFPVAMSVMSTLLRRAVAIPMCSGRLFKLSNSPG